MKRLKIESLTKLKVCLVDHSDMVRLVYKEVLQEAGYNAVAVNNLSELESEISAGYSPDIIISDENNLRDNLAQTLRQNKYYGLIVLFTATDWDIGDQSKYVDSFVHKLGGPNELLMVLELSVMQMAVKKMPKVYFN